MTYKQEIEKAMKMLGEHEDTIFIGQSIAYTGTSMYWTLKDSVPDEKKIELPVFEDVQMGMSIGMALEGYIPISIYPRMDFLLLAFNQLINHLDKMEEMSDRQFKPKVIIRTAIGSTTPLFPGPQHCQDYCKELRKMCKNIDIIKLNLSSQIAAAYKVALLSNRSTILVEMPDKYEMD